MSDNKETKQAPNAVERVALIRQALSVVKQDYSGECSQMATRREYVEDAVSQMIDAGYRVTPNQEPAIEAWSEPCASCATPRACQYDGCWRDKAPAVEAKRGTSAQIKLERQITCESIDGAMAFGYQGTNPPSSDDHWLAPYWKHGARMRELEQTKQAPAVEARAPRTQNPHKGGTAAYLATEHYNEGWNDCLAALARASDHEFKNFHRLLCERFDYAHDEKEWKRDQLSLIEWIATRASEAAAGEPIYQARQHSDEEGTWDDVQEATYLFCAAEPRFYKARIVYAAPQPAAPSTAVHAPGCGDGEDCNACDAMNVAAAPQPASEQQSGCDHSYVSGQCTMCGCVHNGE